MNFNSFRESERETKAKRWEGESPPKKRIYSTTLKKKKVQNKILKRFKPLILVRESMIN